MWGVTPNFVAFSVVLPGGFLHVLQSRRQGARTASLRWVPAHGAPSSAPFFFLPLSPFFFSSIYFNECLQGAIDPPDPVPFGCSHGLSELPGLQQATASSPLVQQKPPPPMQGLQGTQGEQWGCDTEQRLGDFGVRTAALGKKELSASCSWC